MDLELGAEHEQLATRARRVAAEVIAPRARHHDREGAFPEAQVRALAEEGFLTMLVPREHGGAGLGAVAYSLVMTEVARACAATAVTMAVTNMVADAIAAWGTPEQVRRHVPRLGRAEYLAGAFALSEPGAGSDAGSLEATAVRRGDRYVLNGSKCWITSGDRAGVVLVMAKTRPDAGSRGISAFLVDPSSRGFSVGRHEAKMGQRASSTVTIDLDEVEVPAEDLLGEEGAGFRIALRALDGGRIGIASQALGIGLASLEVAARHAAEGHHAGRSLARDQAVQWTLADLATELDAARLLALRAAHLKDLGVPFTREASMAKLFATETANRAAQRALQVLGREGATDAFEVERHLRDVRVTTIYEGTSEIQRVVLARSVLASA
jgi:alkylation response protein AidB-like acyl-CoA dehydrogenase